MPDEISELDERIIELEKAEEGVFSVCPNCGSIDLSAPPSSKDVLEAAWSGMLDGKIFCRSCGYEGLPILFDKHSLDEYERFRAFRVKALSEGDALVSENPASDSLHEKPNPGLSALLSVYIFPGFGQLYNNKPVKALFFVSFLFLLLGFGLSYSEFSFVLFLIPLVYLVAVFDAYRDAGRLGV
ncbi:MAG: hypothetical protein B6U97_03605 [Candidatus Altiarchaeales archaeon ex4484_96]|nr:MAG: hypothetical protein B6U97_03605 [Candidatus Altiarchaeales archaeon ex4484_96]